MTSGFHGNRQVVCSDDDVIIKMAPVDEEMFTVLRGEGEYQLSNEYVVMETFCRSTNQWVFER